MTPDTRLQTLARNAHLSPADKAPWLKQRLRSSEGCGRCTERFEDMAYEIPEGELCCCGDLDIHHGSTLDSYTHSPVHACSYYGVDCECDITIRIETRKVRITGLDRKLSACPCCAGLTLHERIELAAYCGDEASRLVTGWELGDRVRVAGAWHFAPEGSLRDFAKGLARWGQLVCVRAAWAAGLACAHDANTYRDWCRQCGSRHPATTAWGCRGCEDLVAPRKALDAVKTWLDCPCTSCKPAWHNSMRNHVWLDYQWIPHPEDKGNQFDVIRVAAQHIGEEAVRRAVSTELIRWALET